MTGKSTISPQELMSKSSIGFHIENLILTNYVCDFGHMVVGTSKKRSFRLTNVGWLPLTFNFDKKLLGAIGITIEPDKVQKLLPSTSI